ncbi:hypothetical protein CQ12_05120 [Bradyrhizobium jicamae]|uniref:DUF1488 domain-containing protein n=1 Tax=Bradyrhizobium jicamae TaxID=280332 RepID=A0A0R3LT57_9BRAD|nr:hypothetical protein [Bradyrhizobium jicamae]KRR11239.1 hypothetical protein CQ12_05120 [Bradyrhizobium jicamae]
MHQSDNSVCWRDDIDALAFEPDNHGGFCMVHRLAFRTLLQFYPEPDDCLSFFRGWECAFRAAARAKIARRAIAHGVNFHLTSRDVIEQMDN